MHLTIEADSTPEQLAEAIHAYVDRAEALLRAGEPTELSGLDTAVEALCKRILALTPAESAMFLEGLEALRDRVEHLGKSMQDAQGDVAATIKSLSTNKKAATAYRKQNPENN